MRLTVVSPAAARPAMIRLIDARRSVAITGAAVSPATPVTTALRPLVAMSAPMRASSGTCM